MKEKWIVCAALIVSSVKFLMAMRKKIKVRLLSLVKTKGDVINIKYEDVIDIDIVNYKMVAFLISGMICQQERVGEQLHLGAGIFSKASRSFLAERVLRREHNTHRYDFLFAFRVWRIGQIYASQTRHSHSRHDHNAPKCSLSSIKRRDSWPSSTYPGCLCLTCTNCKSRNAFWNCSQISTFK